jgi:hypothetical protein
MGKTINVKYHAFLLSVLGRTPFISYYTNKKEKIIFLIYKEVQKGAVAKSYMRKAFLIYEERCKYLVI